MFAMIIDDGNTLFEGQYTFWVERNQYTTTNKRTIIFFFSFFLYHYERTPQVSPIVSHCDWYL